MSSQTIVSLFPDTQFLCPFVGVRCPFVLGRKNWLFSGTPEGAEASALLYSLIETVRANRLEPYGYLRHIFEKLPHAVTVKNLEALLPWNIKRETLT